MYNVCRILIFTFMTRFLILLALLAGCLIGSAQNDSIIAADFHAYFDAMADQDYDKAWDYFPLEFEELIDRESFESLFNLVLSTDLIKYSVGKPEIRELEHLGHTDGKTYVTIDYTVPITIDLGEDWEQDEWKLMRASLAAEMNAKILNLRDTEGPIEFLSGKKAIAINNGSRPWKFFVMDPDGKYFWMPVLPEIIRGKL